MSRTFFTSFLVFFSLVNSFCNVIPDKGESLSVKCPHNNAPENYFLEVAIGLEFIGSCGVRALNKTNVKTELEDAKVSGNYNEIVQRMCLSAASVFECVSKRVNRFFSESLECTTVERRNQTQSSLIFVRRVLSYICNPQNSPLARFFADDGVECFQGKVFEIEDCITNTYSNFTFSKSGVLFEEICEDLTTVTGCLISTVEECGKTGPAKFIKGLLRTVFEEFACDLQIVTDTELKEVKIELDGDETQLNINVTNDL